MEKNHSIKILIADDHNLFRAGIVKLLEGHPEIKVVGQATNGQELINEYFALSPNLLLVDIAMPGKTGLQAVSIIKEKDPLVKALFLSMYEGDEYIYKAIKSGGLGLINKSILEAELIFAIEQIYDGKRYFPGKSDENLEKIIKDFESGDKIKSLNREENLSYRERQVLAFIKEGLSSNDIANKLKLSRRTIDYYRSCLLQKFNLKSAVELIIFAKEYSQVEKKIGNH
jgi:two-component system response regulator NreC